MEGYQTRRNTRPSLENRRSSLFDVAGDDISAAEQRENILALLDEAEQRVLQMKRIEGLE